MKKWMPVVFAVFVLSNAQNIPAADSADSSGSYQLYQNINPGSFSIQSGWLNLDSNIGYFSSCEISYQNPSTYETEAVSQSPYFFYFDYPPDTKSELLSSGEDNKIIVKSEALTVLETEYIDEYSNEISEGYPKFYYRLKNSTSAFSEINADNASGDSFDVRFEADYGQFEYYFTATNSFYPGVYSTDLKTFIVTERPHSFVNLNINTQDDNANSNTNVSFLWNASKGVETDTLSYTFCIGTGIEDMAETNLNINNNYTIPVLSSRTRYYWKVKVANQYGVELLSPEIFSFVTLGTIARVYNAPNPFNPQKGENTRIFFEMPENGSASLDIYSEYGDRIKTITANNLIRGSNEVIYDGKDEKGRILYNGTYICILKKKYSGHTKTEKCRLLIIK